MNTSRRLQGRLKRKKRIRKKISGTPERPRLSVFKSPSHIGAQLIDDLSSTTVLSASTADKENKELKGKGNKNGAKRLGEILAEKVKAKGIRSIVFDTNGYKYHGRIKVMADAIREKGIKF